jgi:hypothetical protein
MKPIKLGDTEKSVFIYLLSASRGLVEHANDIEIEDSTKSNDKG